MTDTAAPLDRDTRPRVGVVCGIDNARGTVWETESFVDIDGNNDCYRLIDRDAFSWRRLHLGPGYFRQTRRWVLSNFDVVLNIITDVEVNPKTLAVAERITAPVARNLVNDPARMRRTTRDEIAKRLGDMPTLHVPRVMRVRAPTLARVQAHVEREGFRFPAIVRRPATHSGAILGLFATPEQMRPALEAGEPELVFTEFANFRSPDGLYRKMRFFVIGEDVVFRHLLVSNGWNVHARARNATMFERPDLHREEEAFIAGGDAAMGARARRDLGEIKKRLGLDYFGMDCALAPDGRFVVFEINATMNFFPFSDDPRYEYVKACQPPAVAAMTRLLASRAPARLPAEAAGA